MCLWKNYMSSKCKVDDFVEGNRLAREEKQNFTKSARQAAALEKVEEAIKAVELCEGELTANGYKELRARLGHLMDALYKVGAALSKST